MTEAVLVPHSIPGGVDRPFILAISVVPGQIVAAFLALLVLISVVRLVRRSALREGYALLWVFIGVGTLTATLVPASAWDRIALLVGIRSGGATLLLVLGLFGVLLLIMQLSIGLTRLERRITASMINQSMTELLSRSSTRQRPTTDNDQAVSIPTSLPIEEKASTRSMAQGASANDLPAPAPSDPATVRKEVISDSADGTTSRGWQYAVVVGLLLATIGMNLALYEKMHQSQGKFGLQIGESTDLESRMATSGNPLIYGTWVLHHLLAELVGDGELIVPTNHGLDPALLSQVLNVKWSVADIDIPGYTPSRLEDLPHVAITDHTGATYYLIEPANPSATFLVQEVTMPTTEEGSRDGLVTSWIVVSATDALLAATGDAP